MTDQPLLYAILSMLMAVASILGFAVSQAAAGSWARSRLEWKFHGWSRSEEMSYPGNHNFAHFGLMKAYASFPDNPENAPRSELHQAAFTHQPGLHTRVFHVCRRDRFQFVHASLTSLWR